jgi:hypothetical protein
MIAENVNTHAHGDVHLVVLAHLRRRWSLSGKEGFGVLSPSRQVCSAGFNAFMEIKRLFSFAPEARKRGEVAGVFLEKHSSDAGCGSIGRWPSVRRSVCRGARGRSGHRCVRRYSIGRWPNTVHHLVAT